ncbi:MAG: alpha/beta hydrolase [Bdellovibrionales bacterium]|nr:alpha/beta hydrolase [Bdellovibrionales bacterium]NQZ18577.1 alpha/beta hydrolase [Bdellovibrionales bacterium]
MRLILLFALLFSSQAWSLEEAVLELDTDHKVYYRYQQAEQGQPTIVLLNGLIYSISHWDRYFAELSEEGFGVLQIAYSTQPESLRYLEETPFYGKMEFTLQGPNQVGIETQTLIDEVMTVVDFLEIDRFNVLSLSYGSIVASELAVQQKSRIDNLILVAPAVMSSHRYNPYGQSRHQFYLSQKLLGLPIDYFYDVELYNTMSLIISPASYAFEDVKFNDFFNGVYQMARSSKWFDLKDYAAKDLPSTYLFLASLEDPSLLMDQNRFWDLMSSNSARRSAVVFQGGYHALPGVVPEATAVMTARAIRDELAPGMESVIVGNDNPSADKKNSSLDWSSWTESLSK